MLDAAVAGRRRLFPVARGSGCRHRFSVSLQCGSVTGASVKKGEGPVVQRSPAQPKKRPVRKYLALVAVPCT